MNKPQNWLTPSLRYLSLLIIPLIWVAIDSPWAEVKTHPLTNLKNAALDWRYQFIGEKEAINPTTGEKLNLHYVDVDAETVAALGERPWNRRVYADIASALIQLGRVRSVGYDFVLSSLAATDMVPQENINQSNIAMADVMLAFPDKVVLAASFTGVMDKNFMDQPAIFPLIYRGNTDPSKNALPEMPTPPIIDLVVDENGTPKLTGTLGLINVDDFKNAGAIPRWVPLFAHYAGTQLTRSYTIAKIRQFSTVPDLKLDLGKTDTHWQLQSDDGIEMGSYPLHFETTFYAIAIEMLRQYHQLPREAIVTTDSTLSLKAPSGKIIYQIPLVNNQLAEVNWFSRWLSKHNPRASAQYIRELWSGFLAATGIPYAGAGRPDLSVLNQVLNRAIDMDDPRVDKLVQWYQIWQFTLDPEQWEFFKNNPNSQDFLDSLPQLAQASREEAKEFAYAELINLALILGTDEASWNDFRQQKSSQSLFDQLPSLMDMSAADAARQIYAQFADFKDGVVLVGPVDRTLQDLAPSSFDAVPVPKVGVHGNLIKTIFSDAYLKRVGWKTDVFLTILIGFIAGLAGFYDGKYGTLFRFTCILALLGYAAATFHLFSHSGLILPLIIPLGAGITTGIVGLAWRVILSEQQKGRIKGMFGTYLSPTLVNRMVESGEEPQLGGVEAQITAFFSDVQSFSSFSEKLTPPQLVKLMNEYLTAMTDILMEQDCYVDKYIGDAIVGIFNAPVRVDNHALKACIVTQLMQKKLAELRIRWKAEGDRWPPIVANMQMRIGLNTGVATVGNMGSERRFNYTMMGDTVNLAARCESGAKYYGVYTMVTGETKHAADAAGDDCVFRFLDKIIVKGRSEPAEMYEVVCLKGDLTEEVSECIHNYNTGIEAYFKQDWERAIKHFEQAQELEPNRKTLNPNSSGTPSLLMLERAQKLKSNPPPSDWDGVFVMTSK